MWLGTCRTGSAQFGSRPEFILAANRPTSLLIPSVLGGRRAVPASRADATTRRSDGGDRSAKESSISLCLRQSLSQVHEELGDPRTVPVDGETNVNLVVLAILNDGSVLGAIHE